MASDIGRISVVDYGADRSGSVECSANIQNAINSLPSSGGTLFFPPGTYLVGTGLVVPSNAHLVGSGMRESVLKLANKSGVDLVTQSGSAAIGVSLHDLWLHGNDANNTAGRGIVWNTGSSGDGPGLYMENIYISNFAGADALNCANLLQGSIWYHCVNVRIASNTKARGLYMKGTDSLFYGLYMMTNGGANGLENLVIQQGDTNRWIGCYFGGGTGNSQVYLLGTRNNEFVSCINDSAWTHGYRLANSNGIESSYNAWIGGTVTNCSKSVTNTYDHFSMENASANNRIIGVHMDNGGATKGRYGISELNTAGTNEWVGGYAGTFGTGANGLRAAGGSIIVQVRGYNPQGSAAITVGASPYTYTNQDGVPEAIYVTGGTVSAVAKDGINVFAASPATVWLEPGDAVTVTYTVVPTMTKDRK